MEKNPFPAGKVVASFTLASILQNKSEASQTEAEELYRRVIKDAAEAEKEWNAFALNPRLRESSTIFQSAHWVEPAQEELNEIKVRGLGKPAPDILGHDLDGKPLKLSEYRGKVVLLDFWAFW